VTFRCRDCGNTTEFIGTIDFNSWGQETHNIDGDGEYEDYLDSDTSDTEYSSDYYDIECINCNSHNVDLEYDENTTIVAGVVESIRRCW